MKKYLIIFNLIFLTNDNSFANEPAKLLQNLKGCFSVSYRYLENDAHELYLKSDQAGNTLYERIDYSFANHIHSFQHYGIYSGQEMKHWAEHWTENTDGTWTQKVVGPSGQLRYQCTAPFVFNQWRCLVNLAPKPRRDSNRTDYDILNRENTLQFTKGGWVQVENNLKIKSDKSAVSNESGWNEYKRVDDHFCIPTVQ